MVGVDLANSVSPLTIIKRDVPRVCISFGGSRWKSNVFKTSWKAVSRSVSNSNYVVPMDDKSSSLIRPLDEILRDLNRKIPDNIIADKSLPTAIPWYHANRMLSFYAPGWCGEVRNVLFSENKSVTVIYRVTIRGADGEAHRESTGTVFLNDTNCEDPVAAAEEIAFCKACARFGFGLYLYHDD